jgi:hypothetical protein
MRFWWTGEEAAIRNGIRGIDTMMFANRRFFPPPHKMSCHPERQPPDQKKIRLIRHIIF